MQKEWEDFEIFLDFGDGKKRQFMYPVDLK